MRILYIVPYTPSLIRVRPYQLIRALAARGHEVTVCFPWTSADELEGSKTAFDSNVLLRPRYFPKWRPLWNCLMRLPSTMPFQAAYSWDPNLSFSVQQAMEEKSFDVVHVEHLRGANFGIRANLEVKSPDCTARRSVGRVPVVWDSVDCISYLLQQAAKESSSPKGRWIARLDLSRTRRFEAWLVTQFDHVVVTSAADRDELSTLARARLDSGRGLATENTNFPQISVLPNGVDLCYFKPSRVQRDESTLVFSGKMSYHANITAAKYLIRKIMPLVWSLRPDAKLILAGKDPPPVLIAMAKASVEGGSGQSDPLIRPSIEITGTVPDIRPFLQKAALAVVPIVYGAGIQNKILEAMACGTPVVASARSVGSLTVRPGRDLLVASDPSAFADHIVGLLGDRRRREEVGLAGRAYVEANHAWPSIAGDLEAIYREAIGREEARSFDGRKLSPRELTAPENLRSLG